MKMRYCKEHTTAKLLHSIKSLVYINMNATQWRENVVETIGWAHLQ